MRMGGNTGIERIIFSVMLLGFSGMAFAQPAFNPIPASPAAPSFPPAANSGAMSAANDAEFAKVARATAVTNAAEQSSFGKVMSRIFSKRALMAGLRGTPQTIAVGLALEAAMSYFSSDDKAGSPDVSTGSFSGSETWANALLDKGLIATSDVEVHAFEENKNIQLTTSGYVETLNGKFYLTTIDGSIVTDNFGSIVLFDSAPLKPVFITVPDTVEPYVFTPSPVYRMDNFSCPSDVHRSGSTESGDGYKFSAPYANGHLGTSKNLDAFIFDF